MLLILSVSVFLLCEVRSDELTEATWRDMHNNVIQVPEYCEKSQHKNCLVKCCDEGHFVNGNHCVKPRKREVEKLLKFSQIYVYKETNSTAIKTKDNIESAFALVRNEVLSDLNRTVRMSSMCDTYILEDGSVKKGNSCDYVFPKLEYCVDFHYTGPNNVTRKPTFVFNVRVFNREMPDGKARHIFVIVGLTCSSFFCILVLVVYGMVRELRSLPGLIMMAYLATFVVTCILKIVQLAGLNANLFKDYECRHMSPAIYYIMLATFFWLNIMSIEVWRLPRKSNRFTTRRPDQLTTGEKRKLFMYCLYAWFTPALLTLLTVAVDRFELYTSQKYRPPFESCFREEAQTQLYLHVPIGIITISNAILFALAAFAIWKVNQVNNSAESRTTKKNESRFYTCLKIFVLTGATWILELLPNNIPFALYVIVNFYNVFVGVAIFYVLVCKKRIIIILCKRFNIGHGFVNKLRPSQYQSEATRSTRLTTGAYNNENRHSNDQEQFHSRASQYN